MSASDANSKIDLLDSAEVVKSKLKKAVCAPKEVDGNGVISFIEYVLFPISELANGRGKGAFHIERDEKYGGNVTYHSIDELKKDYIEDKVSLYSILDFPYRKKNLTRSSSSFPPISRKVSKPP